MFIVLLKKCTFSPRALNVNVSCLSYDHLEEEDVLLEMNKANIVPLFKKGSRNKSENYRPMLHQ